MKFLDLTPDFEDERGYIIDLITENSIDAITLISFEKGAIRANHYHKKTTQWNYVIEGKILLVTKFDGGEVKKTILEKGSFVETPPLEQHALKGIEKSKILIFTKGPRAGTKYETDTFRVNPPLL